MKTLIVKRYQRKTGNFSLESITRELSKNFISENTVISLPFTSSSILKIIINIFFVAFKSLNFKKILITGDVNYAALLCKKTKVTAIFADTYILNNSSGLKYFFYYYLYFKIPLSNYNNIIVISESSAKSLRAISTRTYLINAPLFLICKKENIKTNKPISYKYISIGSAPNKRFDLVEKLASIDTNSLFLHIGTQLSVKDNITLLDKVSDTELCDLYQSSENLLFLSDFEGYGMPLIEALFFGCNLIISDLEVFREILNDLQITFLVDKKLSKYLNQNIIRVNNSQITKKKVNFFLDNNTKKWKKTLEK